MLLAAMVITAVPAQASAGINEEGQRLLEYLVAVGLPAMNVNQASHHLMRDCVNPEAHHVDAIIGYVDAAAALLEENGYSLAGPEQWAEWSIPVRTQVHDYVRSAGRVIGLTLHIEPNTNIVWVIADAWCDGWCPCCCTTTPECPTPCPDPCPVPCVPGTPGTPGPGTPPGGGGAGGGGNGTVGNNRPPVQTTGLNASAGLVAMLALTGVAGGAGLLTKKRD